MTKPLTPEELDKVEENYARILAEMPGKTVGHRPITRLIATVRAAWAERNHPCKQCAEADRAYEDGYEAGLEAAAAQAFEPLREAAEAGQVLAWDSRRLVAHVQETIRALKKEEE